MSKEDRRAKLSDLFTNISTMYNDIVTEFPEFGTVKLAQTLEEEEKYFASAQGFYKIAVVGSYSTGKTTLLKTLFFDRGLYEVDLPTAADITTQVPTIIKMIPEYTENCYVRADAITPADFMSAVRWTIDQIAQKVSIDKPDFANLSPNAFQNWVNDVAIPVLKKPTRGGTSATNEHFIKELEEAYHGIGYKSSIYKMYDALYNNIGSASNYNYWNNSGVWSSIQNIVYKTDMLYSNAERDKADWEEEQRRIAEEERRKQEENNNNN